MIYLVGGAPRSGKSVLGQQVARHLNIGWVATDVLRSMLKAEGDGSWDATPEAIIASADWFFPHLKCFVWGISAHADDYLIEGVHFLPSHAAELAKDFALRSVSLGCSTLTLERFNDFPGRSPGYAALPLELRHGDFTRRLAEAELVLTKGEAGQ